jgi:hypothetical protein
MEAEEIELAVRWSLRFFKLIELYRPSAPGKSSQNNSVTKLGENTSPSTGGIATQ